MPSNSPPENQEEGGGAGRRPAALRALRHREFRIFWGGLLISVIGTWMQMAAQGWLVLDLSNSPFMLGVVGACASFPMLVFSLPAGVIADRVSKRNIVLVTQTAAMAQAFALAGLVYSGLIQVWHVMVLAGVLGTINAFDMTTRHAMVIELASREDALNAVSLNSTAFQTGRMLGPAMGGLLMAKAGVAACFLVNGITFLPLVAGLLFIAPRPPGGGATGALIPHIGEGLRWAAGRAVPRTLLALLGVSSLFAMPYMVLLPVLARDVFHVGPEAYGVMFAVPGVGAFLAAVTLTARGHLWRLGAIATFGSIFFPLMLGGVAAAPAYHAALVMLFLLGAGAMSFNVVANTALQRMAPDDLRGRVMSLRTLVFAGLRPFGNLEIGGVAEWIGPRLALGAGAAACLACALLAWWRVPELRRSE